MREERKEKEEAKPFFNLFFIVLKSIYYVDKSAEDENSKLSIFLQLRFITSAKNVKYSALKHQSKI